MQPCAGSPWVLSGRVADVALLDDDVTLAVLLRLERICDLRPELQKCELTTVFTLCNRHIRTGGP